MNSTGGRGEHRRAIAPLGLRSTVPHLVLPLLADAGLVAVAFYLALLLRFEGVPPETFVRAYLAFLGPVIVVFWLTNALQGVYARWWGYASSTEATILMTSVGTATGVLILGDLLWGTSRPLPLSVVLIGGLLVLVLS